MKKAAVIVPFDDLTEGVHRDPEDAFLVDDERGEYLASLGLVRLEDFVNDTEFKSFFRSEEEVTFRLFTNFFDRTTGVFRDNLRQHFTRADKFLGMHLNIG